MTTDLKEQNSCAEKQVTLSHHGDAEHTENQSLDR